MDRGAEARDGERRVMDRGQAGVGMQGEAFAEAGGFGRAGRWVVGML